LLKQILSSESDEVKKAITKNFNIAYKTLRLHAANPAPQQNDDREESKEPAKNIESQEEIGLEYSPDKNSMQTIFGSQAQRQGAASMISAILTKRKDPENNNLDQRELNLDENSMQTTLGSQGQTQGARLIISNSLTNRNFSSSLNQKGQSKETKPNNKNQGDGEKKREEKWTLKDELNKRM